MSAASPPNMNYIPPLTVQLPTTAVNGSSIVGIVPPAAIVIEVDGMSDAMSDLRYIRRLERMMQAHCEIIELDEAQQFAPGNIGGYDTIFGLRVDEMPSYMIKVTSALAAGPHLRGMQGTFNRSEQKAVLGDCKGYILHGLLTQGIIPCMYNGDVAYLVFINISIGSAGSERGLEYARFHLLPIRFIESPVPIPCDSAGRFDLQSVQEMISQVEYK